MKIMLKLKLGTLYNKKDENVHRFALSALRGGGGRERERERESNN